jgi:putative addiction module component (TIGR02574 family)
MLPAVLPTLLQLPKRRRLEIAERLWLSIADESSLPVPASHKRMLTRRLEDYRSGRSKPVSHAELMRRVRST